MGSGLGQADRGYRFGEVVENFLSYFGNWLYISSSVKVRDLLEEIERCKKEYGDDFLDWAVYTEQICEADKLFKTSGSQHKWGRFTDGEDWEYFECLGFWTKSPKQRIFTINVNY